MIAKRLDNIDVVCTDVEVMRHFYQDILGLPLRLPYDPEQGWVGLAAGDVVIYFISREAGAPAHPPPRFTAGANPPGIDSFAFEVDDLDVAIAVLEPHGVPFAGEIVESEWYRYRGVHDPEGNLVYLTEPLLDRATPPVPRPSEPTGSSAPPEPSGP